MMIKNYLKLKKCKYEMLNKVGFCCNILFWPHLIHFWAISLQNRLKCAHFWGVSHGKPVQIGLVVLFEKHATTTASLVLNGPVQSSFQSFFSCMDWTFQHYAQAAWLSDRIGKRQGIGNYKRPRKTQIQRASLNAWVIV